jgi:DNA-binding transcriptional LysR family regulator
MSKITLEQWRMLRAVVQFGGFAQASEALHKSQSTINCGVNKLQDLLGVRVLGGGRSQGRADRGRRQR